MNQPETRRGNRIICPVCSQEGQRIICTSGNKSEIIMYHPDNIVHTFCHVAVEETTGNEGERIEETHETDTIETR